MSEPALDLYPFPADRQIAEGRELRRHLYALPEPELEAEIEDLEEEDAEEIRTSWEIWARDDQLWRPSADGIVAVLSGRGAGKTWMGAHVVRWLAEHPELLDGGDIGIAGRTANDVNQTLVPAILDAHPYWARPTFFPSKRLIVWPNGVRARLFSGEQPDSFRGPNLAFLWCDEAAHWRYLGECVEIFSPALRLGIAQVLITTTPLPTPDFLAWIFQTDDQGAAILAEDGQPVPRKGVRVHRVSTYDNPHLDRKAIETLRERWEGTRIGSQELHGAILLQHEGAPWRRSDIVRCAPEDVPELAEIVVAMDPAVHREGLGAESGIVVVGMGVDGRIYVLADMSGRYRPEEAAQVASAAYHTHRAQRLVYEKNNGGGWIEQSLRNADDRNSTITIEAVHAHGSKASRAMGVVGKYQRGQVRHAGVFPQLEQQMTTFDATKPERGQKSDRMDALVHGLVAVSEDERGSLRHWSPSLRAKAAALTRGR